MNQTVTYLQELTAIPSPTGFTREIADYLVKTIEGFGYEVTRTAKGGVNVIVPGVITDKQRYVTAHVDTLGAIVRAVKADGRLKLDRIGGFPWNMIEGENCTVHVANTGKTHSGTILVHQTSCHVYKDAGTVDQTTPSRVQRVQSFKQSVEEALGKENIVIDIQMLSKEDLQNVTLFAPNAAGEDWDLSDNVGWSPDYQDPSTYMDILKASSGENTKTFLGFDPSENNEAAKKVGLYDFEKMIKDAGAETQDVNKRYEKYAAAQAWLTDSALVMPTSSSTGRPFLTRIEPFSAPFAWTGGKGKDHVIYKGMKLQDKAVTSADYNKALEKWQKEQAESNKKAQEDLKKHVK